MRIVKKLLVLIVFLLITVDVKAWKGSYNYEVTKFEIDDNYAYVTGWAILNGLDNYNSDGLGKNFSAPGGKGKEYDRQSGVIVYDGNVGKKYNGIYAGTLRRGKNNTPIYGAYCKYGTTKYSGDGGGYNADYLYNYSLTIYGVKNGKVVSSVKIDSDAIKKMTPPVISLTYAQAYKVGYEAFGKILSTGSYPYTTACYEDVGFKFQIDLTKLVKTDKIDGYKMVLTVHTGKNSTCQKNCSETFDLNVIYVDNNTDSTNNFDIKYLNNYNTKVVNLMPNGYTWKDPGFANYKTKSSAYAIQINNTFDVIGSKIVDDIRWYKIKVKGSPRWIPSSWVKPVNNTTVIVPNTNPEVEMCTSSLIDEPKNENCSTCAGVTKINFSEGKKCVLPSLKTEFYSVVCEEEVDADFRPGDLTLKKGQGFYYGVSVSSTKKCTGKFNKDKWLESYNNALSIRDSFKKGTAGYNEANNIIKELTNMVNAYNNWSLDDDTNPYGTISINYKKNNVKVSNYYEFENVVVNEGKGKYTKKETINLKINGLTNPANFVYTNEGNKRVINLIPPVTYIDRITGEITNSTDGLNGGNKFYTDINGDVGVQNLVIKISNLGKNKNSSITNEKCNLSVYNENLIYRLIDVGNPFINPTREKGRNWLNNSFNFVNTIKSNIWYLDYLYKFDLPHSDISAIKESNYNNKIADSYLGTCHKSYNMQDDITKKICKVMNG